MTQIIISGAISFLVAIFLTPLLIRRFSAEGLGQEIREDGPRSHLRKRGTPTMGGIAILAGIIVAYVATNIVGTINGKGGSLSPAFWFWDSPSRWAGWDSPTITSNSPNPGTLA